MPQNAVLVQGAHLRLDRSRVCPTVGRYRWRHPMHHRHEESMIGRRLVWIAVSHSPHLRTPRQPAQTAMSDGSKEGHDGLLLTQEFPGVSREDAEEVSKRLNVSEDPPASLIAHVLTDIPGGVYATEIWESEAD